jgi:hypothetical protein
MARNFIVSFSRFGGDITTDEVSFPSRDSAERFASNMVWRDDVTNVRVREKWTTRKWWVAPALQLARLLKSARMRYWVITHGISFGGQS